jgi:hypothetical protein
MHLSRARGEAWRLLRQAPMTRIPSIALVLWLAAAAGCQSTAPAVQPVESPPAPPAHAPSLADAEPREPATEPLAPELDGGVTLYGAELDPPCPLEIPGVVAEPELLPNAISIVFRIDGDATALREAVRAWFVDLLAMSSPPAEAPQTEDSERPTPLVTVRARAELLDAPGGVLVVFTPDDLEDLETLRNNVRVNARAMLVAPLCSLPAAGLELLTAR